MPSVSCLLGMCMCTSLQANGLEGEGLVLEPLPRGTRELEAKSHGSKSLLHGQA